MDIANSSVEKSKTFSKMTLGLFMANMKSEWNFSYSQGVMNAAFYHGVNIIQFPMGGLDNRQSNNDQYNIICNLAHNDSIDGLIIIGSTFSQKSTEKEFFDFCGQYADIPIIIANDQFAGFPCVLCTQHDIYEIGIKHLAEYHGYQKIAFLFNFNNRNHKNRMKILNELVLKYRLPINKEWSFNHVPEKNKDDLLLSMLYNFLDHHVKAIFGNNNVTMRIMQLLMENRIKIPEDIAVMSMADQWNCQFTTPAITAVNRNYELVGYTAVTRMIEILEGKKIPDLTEIPVNLMQRQSCGCNQHSNHMAVTINQVDTGLKKQFIDHEKEMITALNTIIDENFEFPDFFPGLIAAYNAVLLQEGDYKNNNNFLHTLELAMNDDNIVIFHQHIWQNILSIMIKYSLPYIKSDHAVLRMQTLWQQARLLIADRYQRVQSLIIIESRLYFENYRQLYDKISATSDLDKLIDLIAEILPKMDVSFAFLVLYENPSPYQYPDAVFQWSKLIMAYTPKARIDLGKNGIRFQTRNILPETIFTDLKAAVDTALFYTIEGLVSETDQIGYIILGNTKKKLLKTYQLKKIISIALQTALLFKQKQEQKNNIETLYGILEKENLRMSSELNIMKHLKQIILPNDNEINVFDKYRIASYIQPSNEMSGEYYDIILNNGRIFLGIGNVSGGKLESSMIMIMIQAIIRALIEKGETHLEKIYYLFNQIIQENTQQLKDKYNLSLLLIKFGQKRISLIGYYENLFILKNNGKFNPIDLGEKKSLTEAISNSKYDWKDIKIELKTGESMVLYTNGIIKARGKHNSNYSERRLQNVISINCHKTAEKIKDAVVTDFMQFTHDCKQIDDVSFVVIKSG